MFNVSFSFILGNNLSLTSSFIIQDLSISGSINDACKNLVQIILQAENRKHNSRMLDNRLLSTTFIDGFLLSIQDTGMCKHYCDLYS
jgi:hypothetical protein